MNKIELNTRKETIDSYRLILDWLEANPQIALPMEVATYRDGWTIYGMNKANIINLVTAFKRCDKKYEDNSLTVSRTFGTKTLSGYANRESVCRKIEKLVNVPESIIPAQEEKIVPAHTEIKVEWECEPILAIDESPVHDLKEEVLSLNGK